VKPSREIATAIRHVLDRNADVFAAYPKFIREHLILFS